MRALLKLVTVVVLLFVIPSFLHAQYTYKIKADSVRITNDSCSAELILKNATRQVKGFLYNKGNGRTEFRKAMIKLNDSLYVFGDDTLNVNRIGISNGSGNGNYIWNQFASAQPASAWIDGQLQVGSSGTFPANSILRVKKGVSQYFFSEGNSSVTPTLTILNSNPAYRAMALAAGTQGSGFSFDNGGYFAIATEPKSSFTNGTLGNGNVLVKTFANGNTIIGNNEKSTPDDGYKLYVKGSGRFKGITTLDSLLVLSNKTSAPVGVNGALYYNDSTGKIGAFENGTWKPMIPDFVAAKTIYVDQSAPNATDTRAGYSKYDFGRPFHTLQAAVNAAVDGDVVYVKNSGTVANLTISVSITLIAESRINIYKITQAGVNKPLKCYNIDFGASNITGNLLEGTVNMNSINEFYNCTFKGSGSVYASITDNTSIAENKFYYCTFNMTGTLPLFQNNGTGGYSLTPCFYNCTVNAKTKSLHGNYRGLNSRNTIGDIINSTLHIAGYRNFGEGLSPNACYRYCQIVNSTIRSYNTNFFVEKSMVLTSANYSQARIIGSTIISALPDTLYFNNNNGQLNASQKAVIENNFFNSIYLRLDSTIATIPYPQPWSQTVDFNNNRLNKLEVVYTKIDSAILIANNNELINSFATTTDADYKVNSAQTQLTNIAANRVVSLPLPALAGTVIHIINRNTSGFTWSTNVPIVLMDGSTTTTLMNGKVYTLQSDGTTFYVISN